ncbi:type I methionyl aminopeptidase [Blastomonas sp. UPD001]|uniref:type I methionyl aminopeptidase n=1 Tax=Blastomonas sp. UPD001 TaxID=2217673 RepID=UPI000E3523B0|nr:type I methionyl aminopeptidase [Blastomonas sp. UPD001]
MRGPAARSIKYHGAAAFEAMRKAGRIAAETLDFIAEYVQPGVSTAQLDALCEQYMRDHGATPATIGYHGYRHASCISVNHVVTHGIPSAEKIIREGDIANIDVTPIFEGWHGDSSRMYVAGEPSKLAARLIDTTYEAMMAGITAIRPGATLGDVGYAIQQVARRERFSSVLEYCGHGIGQIFHDEPQVVHGGRPGEGVELRPGMFFTVEPMLNAGRAAVKLLNDGWTVVTRDRSLSAQFEHTVAVTDTGFEIFTLSAEELSPEKAYTLSAG